MLKIVPEPKHQFKEMLVFHIRLLNFTKITENPHFIQNKSMNITCNKILISTDRCDQNRL